MEVHVYLSIKHLQKVEELTFDQASEIWSKNYFSGWDNFLTWLSLLGGFAVIYFTELSSWAFAPLILFVHSFVAIPLASREMRESVRKLKSVL